MKIVVPRMSEADLHELRAVAPGVQFVPASGEAVSAEIADAEAFYGTPTPELLRPGKRLRWVQVGSAGVERTLFPELIESDVVLTNAKAIYGSHLADHLMAFVLAFNRNLPQLWHCQQREIWESRANLRPMELGGETLLVVGLGGTGLAVARRAAAFDMRVLAVTRRPELPLGARALDGLLATEDTESTEKGQETEKDEQERLRLASFHQTCPSPSRSVPSVSSVANSVPEIEVAPVEELLEVLPEADHIAVCCALTRETYHLFDDAAFAQTKPTAYIHNVTRGGVIDTEALMRALDENRLAGAGLDVTDPEPLPAGHPLWRMPNVLITAHTSGHSPHSGRRMFELFKENVRRFAAGEPLLNVVDKRAEY